MKCNIFISLVLVFVGPAKNLFGGGPDTLWTKRYDYQLIDWANYVLETSDSGYLFVGLTLTWGNGDYYIIKTDRLGELLWAKVYGSTQENEEAWAAIETTDSCYVIGGAVEYGVGEISIMKINKNGDSLWTRKLPFNIFSIQNTLDGCYIVTGNSGNYLVLAKLNPEGDTIWTKRWGPNGWNYGRSVLCCTDGGYIVTGQGSVFGPGVLLMKTDSIGNLLWAKTYGGNYGCDVKPTPDGGYIIAGYGGDAWDVYIIKTNADGDTIWTRTLGGYDTDIAYSVDITYDGYYVFFGETSSFGAGSYDFYLGKVTSNGETLWTKTYGDANIDECWYGRCTSDSGYILCGVYSQDGLHGDLYIIKTKSDITGVSEIQSSPNKTKAYLRMLNNPIADERIQFLYYLPREAEIKIVLYNSLGQEVKSLFKGYSEADIHRFQQNLEIPSGTYFLVLTVGRDNFVEKLVKVK